MCGIEDTGFDIAAMTEDAKVSAASKLVSKMRQCKYVRPPTTDVNMKSTNLPN